MKTLVIAGPNGAGKTTFARQYLSSEGGNLPFVNGDDIAAELNPGDPGAAAQQAGRIALQRMEAYVAEGKGFAIETTLSGRAYAARMRRWQSKGYRVAIIYLRLPSADRAVKRVAQRVREGNHDVPEPVVRRRFERSWRNFVELYRDIADEWQVYDNSGPSLVLVGASSDSLIVPEPRDADGWRVREEFVGRPVHSAAASDHRYPLCKRNAMNEDTKREGADRLPDGEPSVKGVMAALTRAQEQALARAAATQRGEAHERPPDQIVPASLPADHLSDGAEDSVASARPTIRSGTWRADT